jgi:hypothetical protein
MPTSATTNIKARNANGLNSVLIISNDTALCRRLSTLLSAAGHRCMVEEPSQFPGMIQPADCIVVDTGRSSTRLIRQLKAAGGRCIIGVYETGLEHLLQLRAGALWSIPAAVYLADELVDGPFSVDMAVGVADLGNRNGISEFGCINAGLYEFLRCFKQPKGAHAALLEAANAFTGG